MRLPSLRAAKSKALQWSFVATLFLIASARGGPGFNIPYTYQGRLIDAGAPPNTDYDVRLQLYDAPIGGNARGAPSTHMVAGPANSGAFEFTLFPPVEEPVPPEPPDLEQRLCWVVNPWPPESFGVWPEAWNPLYLDVGVKRSTDPSYTTLTPRQELTPTPYAVSAIHAGRAVALKLPYAPTASTSDPMIELTQTGDGPAARFKVQPQPEPPIPEPAVEVESNTSAPALRVTNTANGTAVLGSSASPSGYGVQGSVSNTDFVNAGVYGLSTATNGNGVKGQSDTGAGAVAVWGTSAQGFGGYFEGKGYFSGNVGIGALPAGAKLRVSGNVVCDALLWGTNALGTDQGGAIELGNSTLISGNPYIDFHRGVGTAEDYNVRLINDAAQTLKVEGKLSTTGNLTVSSGDLEVSAGELRVGGSVTVSAAGNVTLAGGDLEVSTGDLTVGTNVTVASSGELSISNSGAAATVTATNTNTMGAPALLATSAVGNAVHAVSTSGNAGYFDGAVLVTGNLKKAYTTSTSSLAIPIAYATVSVDASGNVTGVVGTPNISSVVWESGNQRYVVTIAEETYSSTTHVTTVTPITTASPEALFATTSSSTPAGTLRIRIMSSTTGTTGLGRPFQFVTYKP